MSERIVIELSEDIVDEMSDKEIEITKLQKMMIRDLTRERDGFANQLTVLVEQASKHEIEALEFDNQLDSLTARIGSLIDDNRTLKDEAEDSINLGRYDELKSQYDEVSIKLDVNKKTLAQVLKNSHELERKLADAQFKLGTATQSRDEFLTELTTLKKDNDFLASRHLTDVSESAVANKRIHELELDVSGFNTRMDNACKAAVKQYQDTHPTIITNKEDESRTLEMADRLKGTLAVNEKLEEENADLKTVIFEIKRIVGDQDEVIEASNQLLMPLINCQDELALNLVRYEKYGRECSELVASIHADNTSLKRDNLYLSQLMDFFGGQRIYTSPKGVTVFMLHNNFKECIETPKCYDDEDTPDPDYPVFWVVHPNAMGHMIMINKARNALLLPENLPKKYLISNGLHDEILKAIRSVPLSRYIKALDTAVDVSKKIAHVAEYMDFDFAKTFERADFIKQCVKFGCTDPDRIDEMLESFSLLNGLSLRYHTKQKALKARLERLANKRNKPTAKKKKQKGRK